MMRGKNRVLGLVSIALVLVVALSGMAVGCSDDSEPTPAPTSAPTATPTATPPEQTWDLTFSMHDPEGGTTQKAMWDSLDWIEENSNGRITFSKRYASGTLFGPFEVLAATQSGAVDAGFILSVFYPAEMDLRNGLGLPLLADDGAQYQLAVSEMFKDPRLVKEAHDMGVHYVAATMGGYPLVYHSTELNTYEDLAGKSITAFGGYADAAIAWDGNPVFIPETELYESLQRNLLDIGFGFWSSIGLFKLYEVADYASNIGLGYYDFGHTTVFNLDTWNSLPADLQEVVEEGFLRSIKGVFDYQRVLDQQWSSEAVAEGMQLQSFSLADIAKVRAHSAAAIDGWVNLQAGDEEARRQLVQDWIDVYNETTAPEDWYYNSVEFFPEPQ